MKHEALRIPPFIQNGLTLIAFFLLIFQLTEFFGFGIVDDSLISARYARNLIEFGELSFNYGDRVEGYTSFLWVIGPAILHFFSINPDAGVVLLSLLAGAVGCAVVTWIVAVDFRMGYISGAIAGSSLAILFPWLAWSRSGMETCGFATFWLLSLYFYSLSSKGSHSESPKIDSKADSIFSAILAAVASMTRPEGILLVVVILIASVAQRRMRSVIYFVVFFSILFGSFVLWRFSYFGEWLPNTYYAKVDHFNLALASRGIKYFGLFAVVTFPLFIAAVFAVRYWKQNLVRLLFIGAILYILFGIIAVGGDHFALYRFCVPILPILLLLSFANLQGRPNWIRSCGILVLAICCSFLLRTERKEHLAHLQDVRSWKFIGEHLKKILPANASVATIPIGAIGYYSQLRIWDMYGIVHKEIARKEARTGTGLAGHEKFDNDYILRQKPDVILIDLVIHQKPGRLKLWRDAAPDMERNPVFRKEYQYVPHRTERGYLHLFIRKDILKRAPA